MSSLKIAVCVGETSSDVLAAGLIRALKSKINCTSIVGVAGPLLRAEGCRSIIPLESIAVMGFSDVLKRLPELLLLQKKVKRELIDFQPDIFIGVDAPDFNLPIARQLKAKGVFTVQYVSPTVWAWRERRIFKIKQAIDLVLTLFPFENAIYQKHHVPNVFVGHPMAQLSLQQESVHQKCEGLKTVNIAVLPGSRKMELKLLGPLFFQAMALMAEQRPDLRFTLPVAKPSLMSICESLKAEYPKLPLHLVLGCADEVLLNAEVALVTSGTATLQAMLLGLPMVVAYKMSWLNWTLVKAFVNTRFCALPNILAKEEIVPEFLQEKATPDVLATAVLSWLTDKKRLKALKVRYQAIKETLLMNTDEVASCSILQHYDKTKNVGEVL